MSYEYEAIKQGIENQLSYLMPHLQQEIYAVSHEIERPSVLYRPTLFIEGSQWMALYGDSIASGGRRLRRNTGSCYGGLRQSMESREDTRSHQGPGWN